MQTIQFDNGRADVHDSHAHVFIGGDLPVVTFRTGERCWVPFHAEYNGERQVTSITAAEAAERAGATISFVRQVEAAAEAAFAARRNATEARQEEGRKSWAAMTQAERDAMNEYAAKTEGHTID